MRITDICGVFCCRGVDIPVRQQRLFSKLHFFAVLAALLQGLVVAAEPNAPPRSANLASTVAEVTTEIEEVTVQGKFRKLSELRKAVDAAEDRFYQRYNDLNKDDQYDISCSVTAPTGTRINHRRCDAGYVIEARRQEAVYGLLRNTGVPETSYRMASEAGLINTQLDELRRRMRQFAETDAQMQRAIVEHVQLKERFEKLQKQKLSGRWAVWD